MKNALILSSVLTAMLFSLCSCIPPVQPPVWIEYPGEPDTVHSKVSAMVNGILWQFSTPDTVSRGAYTNSGILFREDEPLYNQVYAMYKKYLDEPFSIGGSSYFNVRSREVQVPLIVNGLPASGATTLGVVRDWQSMGLSFYFRMPRTVTLPLLLEKDSLEQFSWVSGWYSEAYELSTRRLPGSSSVEWVTYVRIRDNGGTEIKYDKYSFGRPIFHGEYDSQMERAWVRIERYDLKNWRVSGKFSFRAVNPKGEVVDIQDGSFENVRFRYREKIAP